MYKRFTLLILLSILTACAHTTEEYRDLEQRYEACSAEAQILRNENARLKDEAARQSASQDRLLECDRRNQELLDKNIACMTQNNLLVREIARQKNLSQKQKEAKLRLQNANNFLLNYLEDERYSDKAYVIMDEDSIKIILPQRSIFPTARSAWLTPQGTRLIEKIALGIKDIKPQSIQVAGHTDNSPIPEKVRRIYPTNWDLGQARAIIVLKTLIKSHISAEIMHVSSFGEMQPISDNSTVDGRGMNRRVEIIIRP